MISIIIPSIDNKLLSNLKTNIEKTIGVDYEILNYKNKVENLGITTIYNRCAQKARFEYLIFCHEDIFFLTKNWGQSIIELLNKPNIGLIGITGAKYKSWIPSPWISIPENEYISSLRQLSKENSNKNIEINNDTKKLSFENVAVIDGCFMAMKKEIWSKNKFDEENLKGFHLYDIDFSLKILQNYEIVVIKNIEIAHFSSGSFNINWLKESVKFHKRNKKYLPLISYDFDTSQIKNYDSTAFKGLFLNAIKNNYFFSYVIFQYFMRFIFSFKITSKYEIFKIIIFKLWKKK